MLFSKKQKLFYKNVITILTIYKNVQGFQDWLYNKNNFL